MQEYSINNKDHYVLAMDPNTHPDVLREIALYAPYPLCGHAVKNINIPLDVLLNVIKENIRDMILCVTLNENCPVEFLQMIYDNNSGSFFVQRRVIEHPNCSEEIRVAFALEN